MRNHKTVFVLSSVLLLLGTVSFALGHDGSDSLTFPDFTMQTSDHEDADPFKGTFTLTVTNSGSEAWGDFHFEIYDPIGGQNISNVHFLDAGLGGQNPWSTQNPLSWTIDNNVVGATLDLYFYNDPVNPGDSATFSVYTDNTANSLPWFGLKLYPTPVPEPASLTLLAIGGLALLRRRR